MTSLWEQVLVVLGGGIFALQFSLMFNFTVLTLIICAMIFLSGGFFVFQSYLKNRS